MLRQHEICWRTPATPDELRIALFGSSAVYGFPLPVEQSFGGLLNAHFAAAGIPAHLFNLGFVTPYQVRDALIIDETLAYHPDVIVYPLTIAEFRHMAPIPYPTFTRFFNMNAAALRRIGAHPPAGLEEPFADYVAWLDKAADQRRWTDQLRDVGLYARRAAHEAAQAVTAQLNSPRPPFQPKASQRQDKYDCAETERTYWSYRGWETWNVLAYLEDIQNRLGIRILVVHWPIAHEPIGKCYSVRYTNAAVRDFSDWIRTQSEQRHLAYLDLRDLLAPELFIDSLHVTPAGHALIAQRVAEVLDPMLRELAVERTRRAEASH